MARETIFETQEINDFAYSSSWGAYAWHTTPSPFVLEVGETYIISWDGEEFERTAFDFSVAAPGAVGVGNAYLAGVSPEPDLVPFIIAYLDTTDYIEFVTSASGGHTVAIYKKIAEPEKIIIKDPDGNDVEYPDKPMIRLNTTKGTALYSKGEVLDSITIDPDFSAGDMTVSAPDGYLVKSAVIVKPEDCEPENILKGKTIGGVPGELEVPQTLEDVPVTLDFSAADTQTVTAPDGYLVKSAVIAKPENLVPENIPIGINIAGVDGAREEAGGGSEEACAFLYTHAQSKLWAKSSSALTLSHTVSFPKAFEVVNARVLCNNSSTTYISAPNAITLASPLRIVPTVTNDSSTNTQTVSYSYSTTPGSSVYYNIFAFLIVVLKITGFVVKEQNGVSILCALENADISALHGKFQPATSVQMVDFSAIQGTVDIPSQMLYGYTDITKAVFPPNIGTVNGSIFAYCPNINTVVFSGNVKKLSGSVFSTSATTPSISNVVFMGDVTTIENYVFAQSSFVDGYVLDMSRCTKVPTLANSAFSYSPGTANNNPQIRVPAALYDEWIATTNWSALAQYIVAV